MHCRLCFKCYRTGWWVCVCEARVKPLATTRLRNNLGKDDSALLSRFLHKLVWLHKVFFSIIQLQVVPQITILLLRYKYKTQLYTGCTSTAFLLLTANQFATGIFYSTGTNVTWSKTKFPFNRSDWNHYDIYYPLSHRFSVEHWSCFVRRA
jgi:hypothetical protein